MRISDWSSDVCSSDLLAELQSGNVKIYAPAGFMDETVGESVLAGTAMGRRAQYQFGAKLPVGPEGVIGVGLGPKLSNGPVGLLPPTRELSAAGEKIEIDGVTFEIGRGSWRERGCKYVEVMGVAGFLK